jgi:hypothetical protein
MDTGQTSDDLLAHFDEPELLNLPDFDWVNEVAPLDLVASKNNIFNPRDWATERFIEVPRDTRRGVCWVLACGCAISVLAIAAGVLTEFAYVLAAERTLSVAAHAGAMEATLPRATYQSILAAVDRRLIERPLLAKQLHLSLFQNGALVQSQIRQHEGDLFAITLSGPSSSAVPEWLRKLIFWRGDSTIQAHAERQLPGRKLALASSRVTPSW